MKPAKNVDEYIAQAPKEVQEKLQELLAAIKSPAPGAEECISYGMPYYDYKGRLVYFQLWKKHQEVSLFDVCTSRMRRNLVASIAAKLRTKLLLDCHRRNVACPLDRRRPSVSIQRILASSRGWTCSFCRAMIAEAETKEAEHETRTVQCKTGIPRC